MGVCASTQSGSGGPVSPTAACRRSECGLAPVGGFGGRRGSEPMVVEVDRAIARRGSLSVEGRYTCSRRLEEEYNLESKVLGSGMSGPVVLASSRRDGRQYAVKSFRKRGLSLKSRAELQNEVEVYLTLDHPHVAKLEMVFEREDSLHLVMEYMAGGELYDRLAARKQYSEEAAAETSYQILLAVAYLHAHKIAHRDLKLENFLYERRDSEHLKLIDFGFAKFWDPSTTMSQSCGSLHYVAPEVLAHSYTTQADMWSVGVLVYMLLTGVPLFHGADEDILRSIKACKPRFSSRFLKLSQGAQDFVRALLVKDSSLRLSASSALEHPWIRGRKQGRETQIDMETVQSLRSFSQASHFRRAVLSVMAWSLSAEDIAELREQFLLLDSQKKGTIPRRELRRLLQERLGEGDAALLASVDAEEEEEMEYSEFLAAALMGRVKAHEHVLRKTFARFDRTRSGHISTSDLRTILGKGFAAAEIEDIIREVDTSGDGKIDYDEFIAYVQRPEGGALEGDVWNMPEERSRKRQTTQKLGQVIDTLMETSSHGTSSRSGTPTGTRAGTPGSTPSGTPSGTPQSRRIRAPLLRRVSWERPAQLPMLLSSIHRNAASNFGKACKGPEP